MTIFPALLFLFAASTVADLEVELKRFVDVYSLVEQEAAEPVDPYRAFYGGAIPGMLRRLDPHSVFFDPNQFRQLAELQSSTHKGFGTIVSVLPGRVIVLQTLPGTPSSRAGIEPGDEMLAVNGISLYRLSLEQLLSLLGESQRQKVTLDILRPGSTRLLRIVMTPERVSTQSVDQVFFLRAGIGYVRVKSFEAETGQKVREAIEKLGGKRLKALVLDLRDNPGGLMPSALEAASLFLPPGTKLLSVRGRGAEDEEVLVPETTQAYEFPLAVLIDEQSASGSEIIAGAVQDHDRGAIVGTPSFGKGLVQSVYPLSQGTGLALTTAFYYTPSGRSIQKPLRGVQLGGATAAGKDYRTASGRIVKGGGGIQPDYLVYPAPITRLQMVLEATASFTSFATESIRKLPPIKEDFEVPSSLLDEFQSYLAQRNIQPGVTEWSSEREWIRSRLRQEIFNQALGVAKGDEVSLQQDPQVLKALEALADVP